MYSIKKVKLTDKTTLYHLLQNDKFMAAFYLEFAVNNFKDYLEYHNIATIADWERVPWIVKNNFISCTNAIRPIFNDDKRSLKND